MAKYKAVNHPGSGYRVVIRFIGKTTTATLMHGDRAVKTAEAKCSPADQFQYGEGAKIAVERLFAKKEKEPKKANREPKPGDKFVIIGNSSFPPLLPLFRHWRGRNVCQAPLRHAQLCILHQRNGDAPVRHGRLREALRGQVT